MTPKVRVDYWVLNIECNVFARLATLAKIDFHQGIA